MKSFRKSLGSLALESDAEDEKKEEAADNSGGDWFEYERFMKEKDPESVKSLNPGATEAEVREIEKTLHVSLPLPYVKLLQIHNGQNDDIDPIFGRYSFASTKEVLAFADKYSGQDDEKKDVDIMPGKGVRKNWWNKKWVPFAIAPGGDALVIDLNPEASGRIGQIVSFYVNDKKRELEAQSFDAWLAKFIDGEIDEREEKPAKKEPAKEKEKEEPPKQEEKKVEEPKKEPEAAKAEPKKDEQEKKEPAAEEGNEDK